MSEDDENPPPMGHNMPPVTLDDIHALCVGFPLADFVSRLPAHDRAVTQPLLDTMSQTAKNAAIWLDHGSIDDGATSSMAADQISQIAEVKKLLTAQRLAARKIWSAKADEAGAVFDRFIAAADRGLEKMRAMQGVYLKRVADEQAEAARIAKEAAEAQAAEAARMAAAAEASNDLLGMADAEKAQKDAEAANKAANRAEKVAGKASVKSATGAGRGSVLVKVKKARIKNKMAALLHYKDHPKMDELLNQLASADVRAASFIVGTDSIPGVEAYIEDDVR